MEMTNKKGSGADTTLVLKHDIERGAFEMASMERNYGEIESHILYNTL